MAELKKGDVIRCRDKEDMLATFLNLTACGMNLEFCYERDGQRGYWLEVMEDFEE
jgi:hypothetical protein